MLGDRATADRLLDQAAPLIGRVDDAYRGATRRRTPHHVEVQRATCYGRTGRAQDAANAAGLWDQIMDSMPESARRDNAVFRARQAAALARVPDPDSAVWAASEAAGAVRVTGSARLGPGSGAKPRQASAWADTAAAGSCATSWRPSHEGTRAAGRPRDRGPPRRAARLDPDGNAITKTFAHTYHECVHSGRVRGGKGAGGRPPP